MRPMLIVSVFIVAVFFMPTLNANALVVCTYTRACVDPANARRRHKARPRAWHMHTRAQQQANKRAHTKALYMTSCAA